jgi:Helix-turn-helix domain
MGADGIMTGRSTSYVDGVSRHGEPQRAMDRPRLVLVDNLELSTPLDLYLSLRALAAYSGCSIRWLRDRLVESTHPLPCYRVEGKILVRRSDFDAWIARYRSEGRPDVDQLVAPLLRDLLGR